MNAMPDTKTSCLFIFLTSALYPTSHIALKILFSPIEWLLNWKISLKREKNPILNGNFAPVDKEMNYKMTKILEGNVPNDISGYYLRNGPN
jgi:hypothetical protein